MNTLIEVTAHGHQICIYHFCLKKATNRFSLIQVKNEHYNVTKIIKNLMSILYNSISISFIVIYYRNPIAQNRLK